MNGQRCQKCGEETPCQVDYCPKCEREYQAEYARELREQRYGPRPFEDGSW